MGTTSFPETPLNADLQKVIINLNMIAEELDQVFSNIDTKNIREIAGWLASRYKLQSKDGDVGFNSQDTAADDIRIWAGDAMKGSPNFKVTKAGILTAVAAIFMSATGFPKVSMNLNSNLIQAFSDANNHVDFSPQIGGAPGIAWIVGGVLNAYLQSTSAGPLFTSFNGTKITLQPDTDLNLSATGGNINLTVGSNLNINGSPGYNGSFTYVKGLGSDGVGGYFPITGSITVKKGLITNVT